MDAEEGWVSVQVADVTVLLQTIRDLYGAADNVSSWTSAVFFTELVATDTAANNASQFVATVFVADCGASGHLCPDLSCATFGICGLRQQASADEQYNIQLGPQISLKGNGFIQSGNIMEHVIQFGDPDFSVPGVVAYDDLDGVLTDKVSTFGLKSFSVMLASIPGRPQTIQYSVQDSDGNTAEAGRSILISCEAHQLLCTATGRAWSLSAPAEEYLHCSDDPFCGPVTRPAPGTAAPSISLVGEPLLILPVNAIYANCPYPRPLDSVCDLGATAADPVEGDLSRLVKVCSEPGSSPMDVIDASSFEHFGVRYCNIDTRSPGVKNVTFWVADSVGSVASVSRVIMVVQPTSPVLDPVSLGRLSVFDLKNSILDPSGQVFLSEQDQALFENLKLLLSEKSIPSITLMPVLSYASQNGGLEIVELPRGTSLERCPVDVTTTELNGFCDRGANVTTSTGEDLSGRVVACPTPECFQTGCPGKRFDAVRYTHASAPMVWHPFLIVCSFGLCVFCRWGSQHVVLMCLLWWGQDLKLSTWHMITACQLTLCPCIEVLLSLPHAILGSSCAEGTARLCHVRHLICSTIQ